MIISSVLLYAVAAIVALCLGPVAFWVLVAAVFAYDNRRVFARGED